MKKIMIADDAGFCFGVKRAMNIAWDELEGNKNGKIFALGPLIHNKQAVEKYEKKGLISVDKLDQVENGKDNKVIIRSHGVSKKIYDDSKEKGLEIVDTTCPFVKKIHFLVNNSYDEDKTIVILGDEKHPEVQGIKGWCNDDAIVIKTFDEFMNYNFDLSKEYFVVSQTTMNEEEFKQIISHINGTHMNVQIENTICSATRVRQQSARDLAKKVDLMVVIGGKHSSNTQKLVFICRETVETFSIETADELKNFDFSNYDTIGVTAGASTPDWIIEKVLDYLNNL
ncbi:4-hydroxy-3-methylbut-2-enyl diphosphate reductase [Peptostreptococcus equinus]|uniref:4-hydroxy-3-methylbut-2-enyl diphosphate reductase n=1 Tax=Peptostreptococcus equinus TaxID=3003601 RepID=A0ABY7JQT3_9FIRM|nr:4-hydroxy-3-methylbut-2-enyl diphosphate reductase [Peptostreptococcus sp. CBA3647]WAW15715.1 4-hydroxy-3-methylbut-2-enyl diphosphate reductase [Peptostreptococcus sp. CBA3647]